MVDRKKKAWELIENHYNCSAETGSRNSKQLKVLYENLKRATCKPRIIAGVRSERI
jgi:hypothetical protein